VCVVGQASAPEAVMFAGTHVMRIPRKHTDGTDATVLFLCWPPSEVSAVATLESLGDLGHNHAPHHDRPDDIGGDAGHSEQPAFQAREGTSRTVRRHGRRRR
jgi:hypothetical protein